MTIKYVRFIWVIKLREQYRWFADQLHAVAEDVTRLGKEYHHVTVEMGVYITCNTNITEEPGHLAASSPPMSHRVSLLESENCREPAITVGMTSSNLSSQQGSTSQSSKQEGMCCYEAIEDGDQADKSAS